MYLSLQNYCYFTFKNLNLISLSRQLELYPLNAFEFCIEGVTYFVSSDKEYFRDVKIKFF